MLWENQECVYRERTGKNVNFAVGSFGKTEDEMGKCFLIELTSGTELIAQVINTGSDVHTGYFDLQQMAGGIGLCNALTDSTSGFADGSPQGYAKYPMFGGDNGPWGPKMYVLIIPYPRFSIFLYLSLSLTIASLACTR